MSKSLAIKLPATVESFRSQIEATIKPYIAIEPVLSKDKLTPWQSKFGGDPYFPKHLKYPKNPEGQPLYLLAQINFAEVPPLENFPSQGILQFYLDGQHDSYGFEFDDMMTQSHFRVLYFEEIETDQDKLITDFSFLPDVIEEEILLPFLGDFSLTFTKKYEPMSGYDYQIESLFQNNIDNDQLDLCNLLDDYTELYEGEEHKLGGYPFFTQDDPRFTLAEGIEPYCLLLQMVSDDDADIWWGDAGVGNFFIQPSALAKRDFSRVIYYYDCC
ncbi:MAG TPA: DUF1963 domain-containing protein [Cyanothece sp. UBA12306]|nr:DUF1963 domain-containing protein [Cyanothece sp. UBA12306]